MSQQVEAPLDADVRTVIEKVAEVRNELPDEKAVIIDALVAQAAGQAEESGEAADATPSDDDVTDVADRLGQLRGSLSEEQQKVMDGLVAQGAGEQADVEAHWYWSKNWSVSGPTGAWSFYNTLCNQSMRLASHGTYQYGSLSSTWGRFFSQYTCYVLRP